MPSCRSSAASRRALAAGALLVAAGCGVQAADLVLAAHGEEHMAMHGEHGHLMGMGWTPAMIGGMAASAAGLALAAWALLARPRPPDPGVRAEPLESARTTRAHVALLAFATFALAVDVMKPATLSFVLPGLREEYGISNQHAALLPLIALTGTAIGSFAWGAIADRAGRRPAVLLATLLFIATAACGTMPTFEWNLAMCFVMGMSAGGFLPVVLTLVAELTPRANRGFAIVLVAGVGGTGGYLAAAGAATLLEGAYGWRSLWLVGLPSGLLVLALQRRMPESHRFLRLVGRHAEAERLVTRFALRPVAEAAAAPAPAGGAGGRARSPWLVRALALYALAWGLVNFGFLTWVPTMFAESDALGSPAAVRSTLTTAALLALPGSVVVAWLYQSWSTKKTLVAVGALSAAALLATGAVYSAGERSLGLLAATMLLLLAVNAMNAVVLPYAAEVFPTESRGRGSGFVAGMGKAGGLAGVGLVSALLAAGDGPAAPAVVLALPLLAGTLALARTGVETRGRDLVEAALGAPAAPLARRADPIFETGGARG